MALTNSQYDAIMRDYNARQTLSRLSLEERTNKVYATIPEYKKLLDTIGELSVDAAKCALAGDNDAMNALKGEIASIEKNMEDLLVANLVYNKVQLYHVRQNCDLLIVFNRGFPGD